MVKKFSSTEKRLVGIIFVLIFVIVAFFIVTNIQRINEKNFTDKTKNYVSNVFGKDVLKMGENLTSSTEYMNFIVGITNSQTMENVVVNLLAQTNNCSSAKILYGDFEREVLDTQCAMQAINEAYLQAISEVFIATQECNVATINVGNYTKEVIDASCVTK